MLVLLSVRLSTEHADLGAFLQGGPWPQTQVLPTQTEQNPIPLDGSQWSSEPPGFCSPLNGPKKDLQAKMRAP